MGELHGEEGDVLAGKLDVFGMVAGEGEVYFVAEAFGESHVVAERRNV